MGDVQPLAQFREHRHNVTTLGGPGGVKLNDPRGSFVLAQLVLQFLWGEIRGERTCNSLPWK